MSVDLLPLDMDIVLSNAGLGAYHKEGVKELLRKTLPENILSQKGSCFEVQEGVATLLHQSLPLVKWIINEESHSLSAILLCTYRLGAASFFYHMLSRWLVPYKQIPIEVFFTADFSLPQIDHNSLTIAEISIRAKDRLEWEEIKKSMQSLDTEIRLGVLSSYHANRILESKGFAVDKKTTMIQEKIGSLIRSRDFDKSIFSQMQRFLVNCKEEFKAVRDYHHISRIISIFHLIRKMLLQKIEVLPKERHLIVKFLKSKIQEGKRSVLGISIGLNFLQEHEVLEEAHLMRVIRQYLPQAKEVEHSFFIDQVAGSSIQTLYIEIEKDGEFSNEDIQILRSTLPGCLKESIQSLTHPLFMPRNEEEILRSIMTLSSQLRYVKDLPQVIIRFDEQKGGDITFTVVLLRILHSKSTKIKELLDNLPEGWQSSIETTKKIGVLRRKYTKEANVVRFSMPAKPYLRLDHSVDLYKARKAILTHLMQHLGEVRDYNGGIIHKETELLQQLKASMGEMSRRYDLLIEKFFYSVVPAQKRCILPMDLLQNAFHLFLQTIQKGQSLKEEKTELLCKEEKNYAFAFFWSKNKVVHKKIIDEIKAFDLPSHESVMLRSEYAELPIFGLILLSEDKVLQKRLLDQLEKSFSF